MPDDLSVDHVNPTEASKAQQAANRMAQVSLRNQIASVDAFVDWANEAAFTPTLMTRFFQSLELKARKSKEEEETKKTEESKQVVQVERLKAIAQKYAQKNPELLARSLLLLLSRIKSSDTKEEILQKILQLYPDHSLADEALDFLLESSRDPLATTLREAKKDFNAQFGREIRAGRNMGARAREFSAQGLGNPTGLRDLYREITGNPRDASTLFEELNAKFTYEKMRTVLEFLLHSLGADLKAKGPSIDRRELHRLFTEARSMQAILGIYRFFKSRMLLIQNAFARQSITFPNRINFELLAKLFMRLLQERYPSPDKVMQLSSLLGLLEEYYGLIIVYTQMRDAVRQVAPKLFKSDQHRQDVLTSIIDTIEELDEALEKEEEEEEEKKDDQNHQE